MSIIAPSILSCDFANLEKQIRLTDQTAAEYIHIDVMDGSFVPNITIGPCVISSIRKFTGKVFDVHLMIDQPIRYISQFRKAGADIITVHAEACSDIEETLLKIRNSGAKAGLSIKPKTNPEILDRYVHLCDMILIMTVEPGFGGQSFIYDAVENIKYARQILSRENINIPIEVDGGINEETIKIAASAGADIFVAGSAVYSHPDIAEAVTRLLRASEHPSEHC